MLNINQHSNQSEKTMVWLKSVKAFQNKTSQTFLSLQQLSTAPSLQITDQLITTLTSFLLNTQNDNIQNKHEDLN